MLTPVAQVADAKAALQLAGGEKASELESSLQRLLDLQRRWKCVDSNDQNAWQQNRCGNPHDPNSGRDHKAALERYTRHVYTLLFGGVRASHSTRYTSHIIRLTPHATRHTPHGTHSSTAHGTPLQAVLELPTNLDELKREDQCSWVSKQYRKLARVWHPDRYKGDKARAERKMRECADAKEILTKRLRCGSK